MATPKELGTWNIWDGFGSTAVSHKSVAVKTVNRSDPNRLIPSNINWDKSKLAQQPKAIIVPKSPKLPTKTKGPAQSAAVKPTAQQATTGAIPLSQTAVDPETLATAQRAQDIKDGLVAQPTAQAQVVQPGLAQSSAQVVQDAPTGLSMTDISADPSKYANYDFSKYDAGSLGTTPPATSNLFTDIGGAKGIADISGGLASLYSIYSGNQQNKRAQEVLDMQKAEYNRGVSKDKAFASNIAKSGLGSYSAGV